VPDAVVPLFSHAADPDQALRILTDLLEQAPRETK